MPEAFFWLFAVALVASAAGVVFSRQAISSVLWMGGAILSTSGIFAYLGATLLALLFMLIYAGAILVLFTFVVMFVGQKLPQKKLGRWRLLLGGSCVAILAICVAPPLILKATPHHFGALNTLSDSISYGLQLFGAYQLPVQLCGWLLLWATVGAFNIVRSPEESEAPRL